MRFTTSDRSARKHTRTYDRASSVVFLKTREAFGGLSNMAGGFPLLVNNIHIRTSEALYQTCRFPHLPHIQRLIIEQRSPMTAKMKSKPHRCNSRPDWNRVRVNVMRWCLRVKLAQNWDAFSRLLLDTDCRPIVEHSRKDDFWGAKPMDERTLVGMNVLGRLLMELRESVKSEPREDFLRVEPLYIPDFLLNGCPIRPISGRTVERTESIDKPPMHPQRHHILEQIDIQLPPTGISKTADSCLHGKSMEYTPNQGSGNLKPYPAYKDSGVKWLKEVPEHWIIERLKASVDNILETKSGRDQTDTYLALEHVESWTGRIRRIRSDSVSDNQLKRFRSGDVLFGKLRPYLAKVARPANGSLCVGEFLILRPRHENILAAYIEQLLRSKPIIDTVNGSTFGAKMPRAEWHFMGAIAIVRPPLAEQAAIVRFLDHADRRIRRYVRAKQKLIVVLEEQKQAVIHQAVTGQIDVRTGRPYPKYKPSRAEWLGAVPESWQVRRSRRVFASRKELAGPNDTQLSATQAYGVIAQVDYEKRVGRKVVKILRHLERRQHVEIDDFVISMRSFQGGLERAWETGCIRSSYIVLQPATRLAVGYFGHLFKSIGYITALRSTANFIRDGQDLNYENFCRVDLPFPPIEEQQRIAMVLDRAAVNIDSIIERSRRQIDALGEYRTRLIADVVTGKLDVREAAAGLPDVDPLAAESDSVDGVDHEAGSEHTGWRHAVEEDGPLADVADP